MDKKLLSDSLSAPKFNSIFSLTSARAASLGLLAASLAASCAWAQTFTRVTVPTWRYDNTHEGQNTHETALTPDNVNAKSFGKLFSLSVDSTVYAQPLYVPGLKMKDGLVHNVLFIATENDSVYAYDADSNGGANAKPIWYASMASTAHGAASGATSIPAFKYTGSYDVAPTIGITGTPAINTATNTMYLVAQTQEGSSFHTRLHALNILTGAEQPGSPVEVTATVDGTGLGSSGGKITFDTVVENQRSAVDYYNGYVYFGFAAHGDIGNWHGWLFAYNGATLKQTEALNLSPSDHGAGIWEAGAGMPIDDDAPGGRMFLASGNGAVSKYPPFTAGQNLSMSILDFNLAGGKVTPTDGFTSYNYEKINSGDYDQGSGGVLMIPDQQGTHPHILVQAGKEGRILVLDRDNLGGYNPNQSSNLNALEDIPGELAGGMWATPAYWNGNVYFWAEFDVPKLFKLSSGVMDRTPASQGTIKTDFPSPSFSVSSNGAQDGIAWAILSDQFNTDGPAVLYAWDANDLSTPIYSSDTNSARDSAGPANKFAIPVVTNGKVYVTTNGEIDVYGLLNGQPITAAPEITPDGGTFSKNQSVTLSSKTASAQIFYTLDGSTPTPASTPYTDPITISTDTTLNAIASAPGFIQSAVSAAKFSFTNQTPPVKFSPAGGSYLNGQHVTIADADSKATIFYTTNGSTPTTSSHLYTGPIAVPISETIKAIAVVSGLHNSNVGTASYAIQEGGKYINFGNGFSSTTGLKLNGSAIATNDTRLQLTNGGLNEAGSVWWNTPIGIQAFTTDFEFQLSNARGNGFTFAIQNMAPTALGGWSAGLGYQNIQKSVAIKFNFYDYMNEGSDSTGVYTDGEAPVLPTVDISSSGIQLGSGDAIVANITYNGTTLTLHLRDVVSNDTFTMSKTINIPEIVGSNTAYVGFTGGSGGLSSSQKILNWTYATHSVAPAFAPAGGTYKAAQKIVLTSATPSAAIYYTTNGTQPTAISKLYSGPIAVSASQTIEAIAISSAEGQSNVSEAKYVIGSTAKGAQFSLSAASPANLAQGKSEGVPVRITPENGFKGKVSLHCSVAPDFPAANDPPSCVVTQPSNISGASSVGATLTVSAQSNTSPGLYTATIGAASGTLSQSTSVAIRVTGVSVAPAFTLSGGPVSIASPGDAVTVPITVTPVNGFTGNVSLACAVTSEAPGAKDAPTCSASQPSAILGVEPVTTTLVIHTDSSTSIGYYTANVTATAPGLDEKMEVAITVNDPAGTTFTISGTEIGIVQSGTQATSTITIAPKGGFTGKVTLACSIGGGPAGGADAPTCSLTQPAAISLAGPVTSTLTIKSSGASSAALHIPLRPIFALGGSGTLAALLLFAPFRRRNWQGYFGLVVLLLLSVGASACGVTPTPQASGTTPGSYTVTVTGTDGPLKVSTALSFLVN
jgi:hypothetical protein